ncbi:MAG: hypothetical protein FDX21_00005 [Chlorobium sp.]|nr:MAG: hypothetical protein FDX21_00005 [Chlorobium sp.]
MTTSGAITGQVVCKEGKNRAIIRHVGRANSDRECKLLMAEAESYAEAHCRQLNLFSKILVAPVQEANIRDERTDELLSST